MSNRLSLIVKGKGDITLTQNDFISAGGQGQIYAKNGTAFKIYLDPAKMIPYAKFQELSVLDDPNIIRPLDILLDKKGKQVGYTMRHAKDCIPLPRLFTKAYREREKVSPETIWKLIRKMAKRLEFIHSKDILVVDYNEMNFASLSDYSDTVNFDVDSYQTKSFPANALMESVRDRHAKIVGKDKTDNDVYEWTELTDWFSFAIVSFQLAIGVHPYKGKHPGIKFPDAGVTLNQRMHHNISVLNKEVSIPPVCYPFDVIPPTWRDWYFKLFEKGERLLPPLTAAQISKPIRVVSQAVSSGKKVTITELFTANGHILSVHHKDGRQVIVTDISIWVDKRIRQSYGASTPTTRIAFTDKSNTPISVMLLAGKIALYDLARNEIISIDCAASALMEYEGRVYALLNSGVLELQFLESANDIIAVTRTVGTVLQQASHMYDGVIIQNLLGSYIASIFPKTGTCYQIDLKELEGHQIIDAKYDKKVLMVVGVKNGKYNRFIIRIDDSYHAYDCRTLLDIQYVGLNFTVLENGVCASLNEDDSLDIFTNHVGNHQITHIEDKAIGNDMRLWHDGTTALVTKDDKVYSISLRK